MIIFYVRHVKQPTMHLYKRVPGIQAVIKVRTEMLTLAFLLTLQQEDYKVGKLFPNQVMQLSVACSGPV